MCITHMEVNAGASQTGVNYCRLQSVGEVGRRGRKEALQCRAELLTGARDELEIPGVELR